ncbi:hypothetical protein B0F90DRAFT_702538 [Multifurca ochricompacta]|uniref:Transmembrane protein n=1 Tax=Multifurca ochricompacta TaxID=376703 RepID=A0AAD4QJR2_9AGAM|nr:hypothetical protein B0F90DRAFT_702538 [Multifurca ochricompacta]
MVNWHNPVIMLNELGALVKLIHVVDGIYLWEFICNLGFEWSLFRGRRQWRWTAALYIACRVATVSQVLSDLVGLNVTGQINCKLWMIFTLVFAYSATTLSLSLYALRSIAVWQRSLPVTVFSAAIVLTNVGAWIRRVVEANSEWEPLTQTCAWEGTRRALLNNGLLLATEVILFLLMAGGIYNRNPGPRAFKIMYREGLLWLVAAVLVQTVPVVFLILNLNDAMNIMFIIPSVICTSIGATRMYRTLSDRQAGNVLDFWETSRDETTGEIRFRRQTQFVTRTDGGHGVDTASTTALPMGRLVRTQQQPDERFVERFEARDIELDDDAESMRDGPKQEGESEET